MCPYKMLFVAARLDDPALAGRWERGLASDERERARRFIDPAHGRRLVLRRWVLRCMLGARLGAAPEALRFCVNAFGRPTLAPPFDRAGLFFSTSHSGDLALIALRIGTPAFAIDIEQVRPLDDMEQIVARFFSPREQQEFFALDPTDRPDAFWRGWTVKEAFVKALGLGLSFPLDHFDVTLGPNRPAAIERIQAGDADRWGVRVIEFGASFRAALVGQDLQDLAPVITPVRIDATALPDPLRSV